MGRAGRRVLPSRTGREERTTAAPTTSDRAKGAAHLFLLRGRPATAATAPGALVPRHARRRLLPALQYFGHGPVPFASMVRLTPLACRARARRAAFILAGVFNQLFRRSCAHGVGYSYTCVLHLIQYTFSFTYFIFGWLYFKHFHPRCPNLGSWVRAVPCRCHGEEKRNAVSPQHRRERDRGARCCLGRLNV